MKWNKKILIALMGFIGFLIAITTINIFIFFMNSNVANSYVAKIANVNDLPTQKLKTNFLELKRNVKASTLSISLIDSYSTKVSGTAWLNRYDQKTNEYIFGTNLHVVSDFLIYDKKTKTYQLDNNSLEQINVKFFLNKDILNDKAMLCLERTEDEQWSISKNNNFLMSRQIPEYYFLNKNNSNTTQTKSSLAVNITNNHIFPAPINNKVSFNLEANITSSNIVNNEIKYEWYVDNTLIQGQNSKTLNITNANINDYNNKNIYVKVVYNKHEAYSNPCLVTINNSSQSQTNKPNIPPVQQTNKPVSWDSFSIDNGYIDYIELRYRPAKEQSYFKIWLESNIYNFSKNPWLRQIRNISDIGDFKNKYFYIAGFPIINSKLNYQEVLVDNTNVERAKISSSCDELSTSWMKLSNKVLINNHDNTEKIGLRNVARELILTNVDLGHGSSGSSVYMFDENSIDFIGIWWGKYGSFGAVDLFQTNNFQPFLNTHSAINTQDKEIWWPEYKLF